MPGRPTPAVSRPSATAWRAASPASSKCRPRRSAEASIGVRTPLGKHIIRQFGDDANVWDTEQLVIERTGDGGWQVVPEAGTTNETLLNGAPITGPTPLHDGDVIAVGRAEKGISRLPLTVRGS